MSELNYPVAMWVGDAYGQHVHPARGYRVMSASHRVAQINILTHLP